MRMSLPLLITAGLAAWPALGVAGPVEWLLTPLSGSRHHEIAGWASWHARLMVMGWGVLLPLGAITARFFKVMPGQDWPRALDNKTWWHAHRLLQYTGVALMTVGLIVAWRMGSRGSAAAQLHVALGWGLCVAGWVQVAAGLARGSKGGPTDARMRGDHYDMTPRRYAFERLHKSLGWLSIVAAMLVTAIGLAMVDAPRWMPIFLGAWWMVLISACVVLQRRGRCMDTYQAIWGPDASHPGNRMPVTGWGVVRHAPRSWRNRFGPS